MSEDYGIKISKIGKSVFSTDIKDLIINSSKDSYKFIGKIKSSLTTDGSGNTGNVFKETFIPYPCVFDSFIKTTAVNPANHSDTVSNAYFRQERFFGNAWQQDPLGGGGGANGNFYSFLGSRHIYNVISSGIPSTDYEIVSVFLLPPIKPTSEDLPFNEDYGIKISKTNKDVFTAKAHELFLTNSYLPSKIVSQGELKIDCPDLVGANAEQVVTADFQHNLGYVPFFIGAVKGVSDFWYPIPKSAVDGTLGQTILLAEMFCTSTFIRASIWRYNFTVGAPFFINIDFPADTFFFRFFLFDIPLNVI